MNLQLVSGDCDLSAGYVALNLRDRNYRYLIHFYLLCIQNVLTATSSIFIALKVRRQPFTQNLSSSDKQQVRPSAL